MKKIEKNKRYVNIHTGIHCVVKQKIFFNIQYYDDDNPNRPRYCHYKRFRKHWVEEEGEEAAEE
jgi:hypothetical protein